MSVQSTSTNIDTTPARASSGRARTAGLNVNPYELAMVQKDLGKVLDAVIAKRLDISLSSVARARKLKGIPSFKAGKSKHEEILAQKDLGLVRDMVIAERVGCSVSQVGTCRRLNGVVYEHGRTTTKSPAKTNDLLAGWSR